MGRRAKPLQQQIELLRKRGMIIDNEDKAKNFILEIGWYRLSLYWFPFELRYPDIMLEEHRFHDGVRFEDALMLYAFDFNLRNYLMKLLERFETAFRTFTIYHVSNRYPESPFWFADSSVVSTQQAHNFEKTVYLPLKKLNHDIILHHRKYPRDRFAPAWKTLEFVTFGAMSNLYSSLRSEQLKREISSKFGIDSPEIFENYMEAMRALRNTCAHGNVLYAFSPPNTIRHGPVHIQNDGHCHDREKRLGGTLMVLEYLLKHISSRLAKELNAEIKKLYAEFGKSAKIRHVLTTISGL